MQFVPVKRVQVTFEDPKMEENVEKYDTVNLNSPIISPIIGGGFIAQNEPFWNSFECKITTLSRLEGHFHGYPYCQDALGETHPTNSDHRKS